MWLANVCNFSRTEVSVTENPSTTAKNPEENGGGFFFCNYSEIIAWSLFQNILHRISIFLSRNSVRINAKDTISGNILS